jgi:hypothetical protein
VSDITWQCAPSGSAVCSEDGAGDMSDLVFIPAGEALVYTALGQVQAPPNSACPTRRWSAR